MKKKTVTPAKILVRIVGSKPKKSAPFAPDLALFEFSKCGRAFECDGFRAVSRKQLDAQTPTGDALTDASVGGWYKVTPAQRTLLVKKAREHAPYWSRVTVETP